MDDGTPITKTRDAAESDIDDDRTVVPPLEAMDAVVRDMDAHDGFAVIQYRGRELIVMTGEKFEEWEDAVDLARIQEYDLSPDKGPLITLDEFAAKYDIDLTTP